MAKVPAIDLSDCSYCGGCISVCPEVFHLHECAGYIEVVQLAEYPEEKVQEAINICPEDCICWQEK
ncbi:MAG: ferredoxin [Deltaproteobacteria bacterium]|nr:ferredoxin [Deltaproteobacteria bacterium]MBW2070260.1 ferredoxin [Deltaproteobacteria bacterium]